MPCSAPQGLVASASSEKGDKARMPTQECVDRIARAAYLRVDEAWISKQPVLGMGERRLWWLRGACADRCMSSKRASRGMRAICRALLRQLTPPSAPSAPCATPAAYVFQLLPALGRKVLKVVGPKRARAMREGKSGYSTGLLRGKKVAG